MKPLVIFEIANNHMGSVQHATAIIKKFYSLSRNYKNKIDFSVKFQYRDSKTFIHNTYERVLFSDYLMKLFARNFL